MEEMEEMEKDGGRWWQMPEDREKWKTDHTRRKMKSRRTGVCTQKF